MLLLRYLKAAPYALFSMPAYLQVMERWKGYGISYLLLLLLILTIPFIFVFNQMFADMSLSNQGDIISQLPPFEIKDGKLNIAEEEPLEIVSEDGKVLIIIDPSSDLAAFKESTALFLVNREFIIFKYLGGELASLPIDKFAEANLSGENIVDIFELMLQSQSYALLISSFLTRLLQYSMMGLILSGFAMIAFARPPNLKFKDILRLMFFALTPVMLLDTVIMMYEIPSNLWSFVRMMIPYYYFFTAIEYWRNHRKKSN